MGIHRMAVHAANVHTIMFRIIIIGLNSSSQKNITIIRRKK
jgi:hypothetical protein